MYCIIAVSLSQQASDIILLFLNFPCELVCRMINFPQVVILWMQNTLQFIQVAAMKVSLSWLWV